MWFYCAILDRGQLIEECLRILLAMDSQVKFLKVSDVCTLLSVSDETVYRWIKQDGLPAIRIGKQWFINPASFEQWVQSNQTEQKRRK